MEAATLPLLSPEDEDNGTAAEAAAKAEKKEATEAEMKAKVKANHLTTEYRFTSNSSPLRTVVTGKGASFKPVLAPTLRRIAEGKPLCCTEGHSLKRFGYKNRYDRCAVCKKSGVDYHCERMYAASYRSPCRKYMVCDRCFKNHREDQIKDAEDPRKHETFLLCQPGSSLSLMLPADAVKTTLRSVAEAAAATRKTRTTTERCCSANPSHRALAKVPALLVLLLLVEAVTGLSLSAVVGAAAKGSGSGGAGVFDDLDAAAALGGVRLGLSFTLSLEVMLPLLPPAGQVGAPEAAPPP